jgi:hypothetical protein
MIGIEYKDSEILKEIFEKVYVQVRGIIILINVIFTILKIGDNYFI